MISKKMALKKALRLFCTPFNQSVIKTSPLFAKAQSLQLRVDNKNLVGYRWNHPQQKKFLIVHGFQSSAKKFEHYITPMINKGYEVLAFEAPAHGNSEGKQVTVLDYRNLLKAVVETYGPIDSFLAHSFGGLALCLALENIPHSYETRVVLIAPATETSTAVDMLFDSLKLKPGLREDFEKLIIATGGVTVEWLSISRAIKNIRAKILWLHDKDDDITPLKDIQPLMQAGYPNVKFMITNSLGHRRIYHQKEVVDAIVSFL